MSDCSHIGECVEQSDSGEGDDEGRDEGFVLLVHDLWGIAVMSIVSFFQLVEVV